MNWGHRFQYFRQKRGTFCLKTRICLKKIRKKSRESHIRKPQPFPDMKRKRKQTKPNKRKSNNCTKGTKISSLKTGKRKSRECHNHKPQPFPDTKRKRKPTNPNKHKSNKHMKSTKISSLFPKRGNRNAKRSKKHKNKTTQCKI